jgi:chromosome segregation ATPase
MNSNGKAAAKGSGKGHGEAASETELNKVANVIQRLFGIVSVINQPVFINDLTQLERVLQPAIDAEERIQKLTTTIDTLTRLKDEDFKKLQAENVKLKEDHEEFENSKRELDAAREKLLKEREDLRKESKRLELKFKEDIKQRESKLTAESKKKTDSAIAEAKKTLEARFQATENRLKAENKALKEEVGNLKQILSDQRDEAEFTERRSKALEREQLQEIRALESKLRRVDPSSAMLLKPAKY